MCFRKKIGFFSLFGLYLQIMKNGNISEKAFRETERKFLVKGDYKSAAFRSFPIVQGYLSSVPGRNVRVRLSDDKAWLTVKGPAVENGLSRFEWEKEIGVEEARELLKLCEPGRIDKRRYLVKAGKHIYEVDEFYGENEGLVVAEIELESEDEAFIRPDWLGEEVTGDRSYYNSALLRCPYSNWKIK